MRLYYRHKSTPEFQRRISYVFDSRGQIPYRTKLWRGENFGEFGESPQFAKFFSPTFLMKHKNDGKPWIRQSFFRQCFKITISPNFFTVKVLFYTVVKLVVVQYLFDEGVEVPVVLYPRGNAKKQVAPYRRTQKTTLDKLKQTVGKPKWILGAVHDEVGGSFGASSASELPRDR